MKSGRNDACACGSGKKYKKCCGRDRDEAAAGAALPIPSGEISAMIAAGRFAEAEASAGALLTAHPHSGFLWKALSVALKVQGKDALHALQTAATLNPEDAEAHSNLANALLEFARFDDAVASYRRTLKINPGFAEAHNNLGNALRASGQLDAALASYRRALELKPEFAEAHNNLGNALRALGQFDAAVASFGRALSLQPRDPGAHNNLGNVLLDLAQPAPAAACYRRALELQPGFAEAHNNLGNAQRRLGQLEEALASYRLALAINPGFSGAWSNASDVLRELGRLEEAEQSSRRALELAPALAGAHNSLGNTLLDLGRLEDAAESYRRALEYSPGFAEVHGNLGIVLRLQHRTVDAAQSCRRALELNPASAPTLTLLAELQADDGRFAEAEDLFRRASAVAPDSAEAWAGIVHLRKMTRADSAWLDQAEHIAGLGLPPRKEVFLRYAIGKYCDDVGDFDLAFANFRRANQLMRSFGAPYDRDQQSQAVDRIIGALDIGPRAAPQPEARRPIFIVGMPRSGTSLAEQILASHPSVVGAGELGFWGSAEALYAAAQAGAANAEVLVGRLAEDYLRLLRDVSPDALHVVDKMPANFLRLGLIHAALPSARIIHMQRDPIDTCLSIYFQHFKAAHAYANDLDDLAHYYGQYLRLMSHWRAALPDGVLLEIPYEALVREPEVWSRKMLEFVDLPWDPRCIEFHLTARTVITASKWQVRQKISQSSVERWRNYEKFVAPLRQLVPGAV